MKQSFLIFGLLTLAACAGAGQPKVEVSLDIRASRAFSGPTQFPPSGFAGYGMLVFPAAPSQNSERFLMFCRAYLASFVASNKLSESGVLLEEQMVTVLPVSSNELAAELATVGNKDACKRAVAEYDLAQALNALQKAENAANLTDGLQTLSGRGPFLLAWSPGRTYGSRDALVLAADLSNTSSPEQARDDMRTWRRDIQSKPEKWRNGWNLESVRLLAQRWVDRRGEAIVKLIGDWG